MTPRVNREKFEKAPPEKKFRYSTKPRFPDEDWLRKYCSRRARCYCYWDSIKPCKSKEFRLLAYGSVTRG